MNKVVSINLNGIVFNIEEHAYEKLKSYIDGLRRHFAGTEGNAEIISDIETRIAELLQMKVSDKYTVIQGSDVDEVIALMGDPRQIDGEAHAEQESQQQQYQQSNTYSYKKLRRDPQEKVIGGVCGGIANYMGMDPMIPRALFLISFFVFGSGLLIYILLWIAIPEATTFEMPDQRNLRAKRLFRNPDDKTLGGVCSGVAAYIGIDSVWVRIAFLISFFVFGSGLLLYIILWIAIPLARTSAEKLQMRGEPIDVSNIERKVKETFSGSASQFSRGAENVNRSFSTAASNVGRGVNMAGQAFSMVIGVIVKAIGFAFAVAGIALLVVLLIAIFGGEQTLQQKELVRMFAGSDKVFLAFCLGIALCLLSAAVTFLTGGVKLLFGLKYRTRVVNLVFGGICFLGIMLMLYAGLSYAMTIDEEETVTEKIVTAPAPDTLYLAVSERWKHVSATGTNISIDDDHGRGRCAIRVLDHEGVLMTTSKIFLKPSADKDMQVTLLKGARGESNSDARSYAEEIDYKVAHSDSLFTFDEGVMVPEGHTFKFQRASVRMKVPVGTIIKADRHVLDMINRADRRKQSFEGGETFRMTRDGLVCLDCGGTDESDWDDEDESIHIDIDSDDEDGDKDVKIRIGGDRNEEGVTVETRTNKKGERETVTKEIKKVGPITIEETETRKKDK